MRLLPISVVDFSERVRAVGNLGRAGPGPVLVVENGAQGGGDASIDHEAILRFVVVMAAGE